MVGIDLISFREAGTDQVPSRFLEFGFSLAKFLQHLLGTTTPSLWSQEIRGCTKRDALPQCAALNMGALNNRGIGKCAVGKWL
jgi:hypothetical protein